jgi:hypothetical protein
MLVLVAALAALAVLVSATKHNDDVYDHTLLRHRSFKRAEQIRSTSPIVDIVDGRADS